MMDLEISDLVRQVHQAGGVEPALRRTQWTTGRLMRKWFDTFSDDHGTTDMP